MISEKLRSILNSRHMTMEQLATMSDIPLETIRNLMYQKAKNPRLNTILSICKALNISVESFVSDDPIESESQLMEDYNNCSPHGKYLIRLIASMESELTAKAAETPLHHEIICFQPHGSLSSTLYGTSDVLKIHTTCPDAYLAVQMPNNDFAPLYCQNDILLLTQRFPQDGENAIFSYQSRIYLSKFQHSYDNDYTLHSICGQNRTLHFKRMDCCRLIGTCIGIARERSAL